MIELIDVDKVYGVGTVNENRLFKGFSFKVKKGSFVSIVGSNGSGKTTMLNIIGGSLPIEGGKVLLDGKDITAEPEYKRARRIGRVFQDPSVGTVPEMTIYENMSLAANKGKRYGLTAALDRGAEKKFREEAASLGLGLEDKMNMPVGLLSGGQRQALSLLMSTMTPIDLLLLDEHTAALDPKTAETVMELTDKIVKEKKLTAVMVTHNLRFAVKYGDRIVMMHEGTAVLDRDGADKAATEVADILGLFNEISVECGN